VEGKKAEQVAASKKLRRDKISNLNETICELKKKNMKLSSQVKQLQKKVDEYEAESSSDDESDESDEESAALARVLDANEVLKTKHKKELKLLRENHSKKFQEMKKEMKKKYDAKESNGSGSGSFTKSQFTAELIAKIKYQAEAAAAKKAVTALQKTVTALQKTVNMLEKEKQKLATKNNELETSLSCLKVSHASVLKAEKKKFADLTSENASVLSKFKLYKQDFDKVQKAFDLESTKIQLQSLKSEESGKSKTIASLEKSVTKLNVANEKLANKLNDANEKLKKRNNMRSNGQNSLAFATMNPLFNNTSMMQQLQFQQQRAFNFGAIPPVTASGIAYNGTTTNFNPLNGTSGSSGNSRSTTGQSSNTTAQLLARLEALEALSQIQYSTPETTPARGTPNSIQRVD
jgi:DNA repair exonuclease SbcCD ATPase subunit